MTAQSPKARVAKHEQAQRELGRTQGKIWAHPPDWPAIRRYVQRLNRNRERS